jgi:hypothetical protein
MRKNVKNGQKIRFYERFDSICLAKSMQKHQYSQQNLENDVMLAGAGITVLHSKKESHGKVFKMASLDATDLGH